MTIARRILAKHIAATIALTALVQAIPAVAQQGFPNEPIHILVPSGAGSFLDTICRQVGERVAKQLGQPVIVENRAGASGMIAYEIVRKAKPDGYTLGAIQAGFISNRFVYKSAHYDEFKDYVPVAMIARTPMILVTGSQFKARNLNDLRQASKAVGGKMTYASVNGANYLNTELMRRHLGLDLSNIPYKEANQAMTDVMAGNIDTYLTSYSAAKPLLTAGKLRAYATLGKERIGALTDVPSGAELGFTGDIQTWAGIVAPAGTPEAIVVRLRTEIDKAVAEPAIRKQLQDAGYEPYTMSGAEFTAMMKREMDTYAKVARETGIKPE